MKIQTIHNLKLPYTKKIKGLNWILNRLVRIVENIIIRKATINSCVGKNTTEDNIIISLTTYPARTEKVIWTIKSLLNQNVWVDRLILWLAEEQYPNKDVPQVISEFEKYGLEICFCDDIKSHKKYYYTMLNNPEAVVITADDDVIYPENTVEKLLKKHWEYPNAVICNQARWINIKKGEFAPYKEWSVKISKQIDRPDYKILPIGEGAVLYPPFSLDKEVFDKSKIEKYAMSADDLWLKLMAVINGTKAAV